MKRNRKNTIFVGAMRCGKTHLATQYALAYIKSGGAALAYNLGRPTDFGGMERVDFLDTKKTLQLVPKTERQMFAADPQLLYYENEDGSLDSVKEFSANFKGRAARAYAMNGKGASATFYQAIYEYFYNTLVILDDTKGAFRNGLNAEACDLFSRINHTGLKQPHQVRGCDFIFIFHAIDHVNPFFWDVATDVVLFRTNFEPERGAFKSDEMYEKVLWAYNYLKQFDVAERRRVEINIEDMEPRIIKPTLIKS